MDRVESALKSRQRLSSTLEPTGDSTKAVALWLWTVPGTGTMGRSLGRAGRRAQMDREHWLLMGLATM